MNDKIQEKKTKRIIEKIEGLATYVTMPRELAIYNVNINSQEAKLLVDYITNLQHTKEYLGEVLHEQNLELEKLKQENQELKSELECYENGVYFSNKVDELERENEKLKERYQLEKEVYKSRIEKAVKYIEKLKNFKIKYVMLEEKELYATENDFVKELLNILNGRSE